jgi:hypothetical protein
MMMKKILVFTSLLLLIVPMLSSAQTLDSKYIFEDLEEVDSFRHWNITGWQVLDTQSLLIDYSGSRSYLLILRHNIPGFRLSNEIELTSSNEEVKAGIDRVLGRGGDSVSSVIEKIYVLPDRDARQAVRERLIGNPL